EGAGTLEFLLDDAGEFYFMEMNTRLQVEHPVTEAITGLDLVELQLRVAAGEPLPMRQEDVTFSGHAIEVRLCAEDAAHDFMPQSGRMLRWQAPAALRVEDALESGCEIPPFYDSMIAKLIVHADTREAAIARMKRALREFVVDGVKSTIPFHLEVMDNELFKKGTFGTDFLEVWKK
ncbi:MAG TPA: 3-methylcrotonyl-CoA carboxylase, partial [Candidatus Sumerlaeota bacterium]|nr:3-methylcrotonyl-CoA carboxylase [Candidatus Sumerlaeota bacterium]